MSRFASPLAALAVAALLAGCGDDSPTAPPTIATLAVSAPRDTVGVGDTLRLAVIAADRSGQPMVAAPVAWRSSSPARARVDSTGLVTALDTGTVELIAESGAAADTARLTVRFLVRQLTITVARDSLRLGDTLRVTVTARDGRGAVVPDAVLAWAASDTAVLRVESTGLLRTVAGGEADVVVIADGVRATRRIRVVPPKISTTLRFASLTGGRTFMCGLTAEGAAHCWGTRPWETTAGHSATPVAAAPALRFSQIDAGDDFLCGVTTPDGALYCLGLNNYGQFGNGVAGGRFAEPVRGMAGLVVRQVAAGYWASSCAVTTDDMPYCFGRNIDRTTGRPTLQYDAAVAPPVGDHRFRFIETGAVHACGLTPAGAAYCWGQSYLGATGHASGAPVPEPHRPNPIPGGLTFTSIVNADYTSCAVATNGTAYCWGYNGEGALGRGTMDVEWHHTPEPVAGNLKFASLAAALWRVCGLTTDGFVYCWGSGNPAPRARWVGRRFRTIGAAFYETCGVTVETEETYCF